MSSIGRWRKRIARVVKAKKPPTIRKRKPLPTVVIPPKPPRVKPPTHAEARQMLAEHGKAISAPNLAATSETPATRDYTELDEVTKKLSSPSPKKRRRPARLPWVKEKPATTPTAPKGRIWHGKYADLTNKPTKGEP